MQNKQTTVKQQKNTVPPEASIQRWKQQRLDIILVLCKYHLYEFRDNGISVLSSVIKLNEQLGAAFTSDAKEEA
jgi:hypothetical protein